MSMDIEIKNAVENLGKTFHEFKAKNDQQIAELAKGRQDPVLAEQVEKLSKAVGEFDALKRRLDEIETKGNRPGRTAEQTANEHKQAFNTFLRKGRDDGLADLQEKAVNVGSDTAGGYAVSETIDSQIVQLERDNVPMRGLANVIQVSNEDYKKLVNMGGAAAGWVGETAARPETASATLQQVAPSFGEVYANPATTQKALDDMLFDVEAWLAGEVAITFAEYENAAFTTGSGTSQPKGILNYTLATGVDGVRTFGQIQRRNSGSAGVFTGDSLMDLIHDLKRGYRMGAVWMMSNLTLAYARKLKDADDNYLWRPGLEAGQSSTLLGYTVEENDDMPDIAASANAIIFGNFRRGYTIADVRGTRVLRDPFSNKPYVHFYTTKRVGGGVTDDRAFKVLQLAA